MWYFEKIILQCGQSSMNKKLTMIGLITTAELHSRKPEHRFCVASNLKSYVLPEILYSMWPPLFGGGLVIKLVILYEGQTYTQ